MSDQPVIDPAAARRVEDFVERERGALIALCARLIEARSVNPPGHTDAAAKAIRGFLAGRGLDCELPARTEGKPNLVASTAGVDGGRHLVFNGHLDTISPGVEDDWSVPVYRLLRRDGRLYGLGAGNMKAALAAMSLAYAFLAAHSGLWRGRVTLTAVADETVFGPDGAGWLLEQRPELYGDALICGEGPGGMRLAIAEKGLLWIELNASAPAAQGMLARPRGAATTRLAAALCALDELNERRARAPAALALPGVEYDDQELRLSVNVGTLSGGSFISQSATEARAEIDFRIPPGLDCAAIESEIARIISGLPGLCYRRIRGWDPNWIAPDAELTQTLQRAVLQVRGGRPQPAVRLPASDARRWRERGVPALCYGPQPLLASGTDDFAYLQDTVDCAKIYALTALEYFAAGG